jgi:hypothetical protein
LGLFKIFYLNLLNYKKKKKNLLRLKTLLT